jgi:hypothetical protein
LNSALNPEAESKEEKHAHENISPTCIGDTGCKLEEFLQMFPEEQAEL